MSTAIPMRKSALLIGLVGSVACNAVDPESVDAPRDAIVAPDARASALSFVSRHGATLGIRDVDSELHVAKVESDPLGMTHVRMQQTWRGLRVVGGEILVHESASGRITSATTFVPGIDLDVEAKVSSAHAVDAARAAVAERTGADVAALESTAPELVVFAADGSQPALAWTTTVRSPVDTLARMHATVDAVTGRILELEDVLQRVQGSGVGVLGDRKSLEVTAQESGYVLADASRVAPIRTFTAENKQVTSTGGAKAVTSSAIDSWDTAGSAAGAAVDAHAHAGIVVDYFWSHHQRRGFDGEGKPLVATVHFGSQYDNAFWDPDLEEMAFGDGGQLFKPLSAALDTVAHEFTHGVTSRTSQLRYQGQSGALNEALSDIFGAFVEHAARPDDIENWQIGEDIARVSGLLRDLRDPRNGGQPAHMSNYVQTQQDSGGVHINSGIINHAAFLMTVGGRNPISGIEVRTGIGWEKSERLWYRANTRYFLSSTTFAQVGPALVEAAIDLGFTPEERATIETAITAVGLSAQVTLGPAPPRPAGGATEMPRRGAFAGNDQETALGPRGVRRDSSPQAGCSVGFAPSTSGFGVFLLVMLVAGGCWRRKQEKAARS